MLSVAAYFYNPEMISNSDSVALVVGALSGILLSPDLDVDGGYIGLHFLRSIPIIGWPISKAWELFWKPYAVVIPHRSWISHFPVISTTIRVGILFVCFGIPLALMNYGSFKILFVDNIRTDFMWFIGLCISDGFHYFADKFSGDLNSFAGKDE